MYGGVTWEEWTPECRWSLSQGPRRSPWQNLGRRIVMRARSPWVSSMEAGHAGGLHVLLASISSTSPSFSTVFCFTSPPPSPGESRSLRLSSGTVAPQFPVTPSPFALGPFNNFRPNVTSFCWCRPRWLQQSLQGPCSWDHLSPWDV